MNQALSKLINSSLAIALLSAAITVPVYAADLAGAFQTKAEQLAFTDLDGSTDPGVDFGLSTSGQARFVYNSSDDELQVSLNGASYSPLGLWSESSSILHPKASSGAQSIAIGGTGSGDADIFLNLNGAAVFNEQGASSDFRVEGSGDENLLFVDGANDRAAIGDSSPDAILEISASGGGDDLLMLSADDGDDGNHLIVNNAGQVSINGLPTGSTAELNVQNGAVLYQGSTGSTPLAGLIGNAFMWIPDKGGAIRSGFALTPEWNAANIGNSSIAMGSIVEAQGVNAVALGGDVKANGNASVAIGTAVDSLALSSLTLGTNLEATATGAMSIGRGVTAASLLTNNVTNSLMIGFNSDVPTFFVGPSAGAGTVGNIGMGLTNPAGDPPGTRLDINGGVTHRGIATASAPAVSPTNQGRIYFDSDDDEYKVSENGGAYVPFVPKVAQVINTNGGIANLNIAPGADCATCVSIPWNLQTVVDSAIAAHTLNGTDITINRTGLYRVSYSINHQNDGPNNNASARVNLRCQLEVGGSPPAGLSGVSFSYSRDDSTTEWATNTASVMLNLTASDLLSVECGGEGNLSNTETLTTTTEGQSWLNIELIR